MAKRVAPDQRVPWVRPQTRWSCRNVRVLRLAVQRRRRDHIAELRPPSEDIVKADETVALWIPRAHCRGRVLLLLPHRVRPCHPSDHDIHLSAERQLTCKTPHKPLNTLDSVRLLTYLFIYPRSTRPCKVVHLNVVVIDLAQGLQALSPKHLRPPFRRGGVTTPCSLWSSIFFHRVSPLASTFRPSVRPSVRSILTVRQSTTIPHRFSHSLIRLFGNQRIIMSNTTDRAVFTLIAQHPASTTRQIMSMAGKYRITQTSAYYSVVRLEKAGAIIREGADNPRGGDRKLCYVACEVENYD